MQKANIFCIFLHKAVNLLLCYGYVYIICFTRPCTHFYFSLPTEKFLRGQGEKIPWAIANIIFNLFTSFFAIHYYKIVAIIAHDTPDFIHNYRIVHDKDSIEVIKGLHFTFIELPKFTPHSITDKRMMLLWLCFLTEINSNTKEIPAALLNAPEIRVANKSFCISGNH